MRNTLMYTLAAFTAIAALATPARADATTDIGTERASLIGSWVQNGGPAAWVIDSRPDGLHVTQVEGSAPVADFQCNTDGQSCEIKIGGHKATVSMYYNGPALVQLETKGNQVVKRRFEILPSGAMKVEVTPMSATSTIRTEELEFERGKASTASK
jgi:hypothetical protein